MLFTIRPVRRFPVHCAVAYHAGTRLTLTLPSCSAFWLLSTFLLLNSGPAYAEWVSLHAAVLRVLRTAKLSRRKSTAARCCE